MTHSDDDLVRRFSSVALRRGQYVISVSTRVGIVDRRPIIETSSQEAQLLRIMIREYCQQELTAHSSRLQKQAITSAMTHFKKSESTIKQALYEQPFSITAPSS